MEKEEHKPSARRITVYTGIIAILGVCVLALCATIAMIEIERSRLSELQETNSPAVIKENDLKMKDEPVSKCAHGTRHIFNPEINEDDPDVFDDLTSTEIKKVVDYMKRKLKAKTSRKPGEDGSIIDYMRLAPPPKGQVIDYMSQHAGKPERYAHVAVVTFDQEEEVKMVTKVYKVGPLSGEMSHTDHLEVPELSQKMNEQADIIKEVIKPFMIEIEDVLQDSYKAKFDCNSEELIENPNGCIKPSILTPFVDTPSDDNEPSKRQSWWWFLRATENEVLYPLGLEILVNHDLSLPASSWTIEKIYYNFQSFDSTEDFLEAYNSNGTEFKKLVLPLPDEVAPDIFSAITRRSSGSSSETSRGPQFYQHDGRRYSVVGRRVTYMDWSFYLTMNPVTGLSVMDIRFDDQRVAYEISLQELGVQYSGFTPVDMLTAYLDSMYLIGKDTVELVPGIDCPNHAEYMSTKFYHGKAEDFTEEIRNNICIFEWNTAMPLKRHLFPSGPARYNGMENIALVVRVVPTIYNYDYIQDIVFYQNGNIEVKATLDGYVQAGLYDSSLKSSFSSFANQIHDRLQATLHNHLAHFKVDLDVLGTENSYRVAEVRQRTDEIYGISHIQDGIVISEKESELDARWHKDFNAPKIHLFYNSGVLKNTNGVERAWQLEVATPGQNLRSESRMKRGFSFSYQQMATTVRKENESTSSSVYNGPNPYQPVVDFSSFFQDNESLVQQDLVAWVTLGKYHFVKSEDLPIVTTPGNTLYFSLKPFNFFKEDPSMKSNELFRFSKETSDSEMEITTHCTDLTVCYAENIFTLMEEYSMNGF